MRGDEIGRRAIRVNFGGFVTGPGIPSDAPIPFNGGADTGVEVKGPPKFRVRVSHPAGVVNGVPRLGVEITNDGDAARRSSQASSSRSAPPRRSSIASHRPARRRVCTDVPGTVVHNLRHLFGRRLDEVHDPAVADGADRRASARIERHARSVGRHDRLHHRPFPPPVIGGSGEPTVTVLPFANAQGIGVESPVTALFSEAMDEVSVRKRLRLRPDGRAASGHRRRDHAAWSQHRDLAVPRWAASETRASTSR